MTAARRRAAAVAAFVGFSMGSPLHGQTSATLGMSASVVEYEGYLASGAATLAPTVRFDGRDFSAGGQGSWTLFESGNRILQASAAAAWLVPAGARWRVELAGAAGVAKYADTPAGGHILGRGRLHIVSEHMGGWAGGTAGAVSDGTTELPVEIELGVWGVRDRLTVIGTVTGTGLGKDHHLDLLGAARWTGERVELETRVGARPWTDSGGGIGEAVTGVFAEVSAVVSVSSRISLALGAGSAPADPVRRALAARYVTAGLRLALVPAADAPPPPIASAALAALRARTASAARAGAGPMLDIEPADEMHVVRIRVSDVRSVELMADFTDWLPVELTRVKAGVWELRVPVMPGVHRLNVRIDAGEWLVPVGARAEPGEFGGVVGVVVVR